MQRAPSSVSFLSGEEQHRTPLLKSPDNTRVGKVVFDGYSPKIAFVILWKVSDQNTVRMVETKNDDVAVSTR